jgi:hypothetical protein
MKLHTKFAASARLLLRFSPASLGALAQPTPSPR